MAMSPDQLRTVRALRGGQRYPGDMGFAPAPTLDPVRAPARTGTPGTRIAGTPDFSSSGVPRTPRTPTTPTNPLAPTGGAGGGKGERVQLGAGEALFYALNALTGGPVPAGYRMNDADLDVEPGQIQSSAYAKGNPFRMPDKKKVYKV